MRRRPPKLAVVLLVIASLVGCSPQQPFYFHGTGDLSRYIGMATEIENPDVCEEPLREAAGDLRPFSVGQNQPKEVWSLRLEDAVRYTLENSKVFRTIDRPVSSSLALVPAGAETAGFPPATIYDSALTETNVAPGNYGVQAALSQFDAQLTTTVFWEKNREPQDNFAFLPLVLHQDTAQFQTQLSKVGATGTTFTVQHNVTYDLDNNPRVFPAAWNTNFEVEVRQPLWQGNGVEFNRIGGPNAQPGLNQGVVIARINTDISLAAFEASVRDLVSQVETTYWDLYFAYRNLDAAVSGRDSALGTWQKTYALFKAGAKGGEKSTEAQAREQYFLFRSTVEQGLNALYTAERKLRLLMGLAATDGRLIRPADEPTVAKVAFDWTQIHGEALSRSVELRAARWRVKRREMEVIAAKNWLLPRLDAVARYKWLGMGQNLVQEGGGESFDANGAPLFGGSYENLFGNNYQDWHLGLELHMPIGFRKELSGVRNAQLGLARERAVLKESELDISSQLATAIADLDANLALCQTNYNRRIAAERNVEAVQAAYDTGTVAIDVLLQAQRLLAQAESDYYRSLAEYNKSIMQVHLRKGSLLEYNGVYLAEGPWPGKAYFDARRRAVARDAAKSLDYGFTMPRVISRGPYQQHEPVENPTPVEADRPAPVGQGL